MRYGDRSGDGNSGSGDEMKGEEVRRREGRRTAYTMCIGRYNERTEVFKWWLYHTETEPGGGGGWWWSFGGFQVNPEKVGLLWREMAICVAENRVGPF